MPSAQPTAVTTKNPGRAMRSQTFQEAGEKGESGVTGADSPVKGQPASLRDAKTQADRPRALLTRIAPRAGASG